MLQWLIWWTFSMASSSKPTCGGTECNLICYSIRNHTTDIPNVRMLQGLEKISVRCKDHSVNRMFSE